MSEPPAVVPPGMSKQDAAAHQSEMPPAHRLTEADLEGIDVQKIRCRFRFDSCRCIFAMVMSKIRNVPPNSRSQIGIIRK